MAKIKLSYPSPEINRKIEEVERQWNDKVTEYFKTQVSLIIWKRWSLIQINKELDECLSKWKDRGFTWY